MKQLKFPNLFSPLQVNGLMLKNRVIAAPMGIPKANLLSTTYYGGISLVDKANGGSAGVVVSSNGLCDLSKEKNPFNKYARDVTREVFSVLEQSGAVGIIEFDFHPKENPDGTIQGPSDGIAYNQRMAKEMTIEQMQQQINELSDNCKKAKDFGIRMIMLHFGHDSQCSIFLSPHWNQRKDAYGGSVENRTRFAREALRAVRAAVGPNFPIMVRISKQLMVPETYAEEDMLYFIRSVKDDVDLFNISAGMDCYGGDVDHYEANIFAHSTIFEPRYLNLDFAQRVKRELGVNVCLVGGVSDPNICEKMIAEGKIDAVMLGRQLVADPYWTYKAEQGKEDEIVPCLRCLNCYHIASEHSNVQCSVNPRFRRENRVPLVLSKTNHPKKVVVVGGGPAGMKAALTADERGHDVVLLEKESILGGQLNVAQLGVYKEDIRKFNKYLVNRMENSSVKVYLNTCADKERIEELNPDALIIAIGANFITPKIKGIEYAKQAYEAYEEGLETINGKTLIVGGGTIGTELALELAEQGKDVTIVEMSGTLCSKGNKLYRIALRQHLDKVKNNLHIYLNSQVTALSPKTVTIQTPVGCKELYIDQVYLSVGLRSKKEEAYAMYGITPSTTIVGDCKQVATIIEAINDGYFAGANCK